MKQIIKHIILMSLFLIGVNASSVTWAPIMMGDITTFVSYAQTNEIKTLKNVYKPNELVSVKVNAALSGDQDWVGVYSKNAVNNWENVVAWNWIPNNGTFALSETTQKSMPIGAYEARLFFHNNFELKASYPFTVSTDTFKTIKPNYNVNETVSVLVNVPLSGKKDWVGIYPKNADNSWKNVIAWNWITSKGTFVLNKDPKAMPAGEYEARLFWHNEHGPDAIAKKTFGFSVGGGAVDYAAYGSYQSIKNVVDNHISIYKAKKDGVFRQQAPVVIFGTGGWGKSVVPYEKFINFIVSKGYLVIGVSTDPGREEEFQRILSALNDQGNFADKTKIGLMGNSTGGGAVYYNLKRLKDHDGYATDSFIVSLDGWFALGLTSEQVGALDTNTLIMQFGGADGIKDNRKSFFQDPRIFMGVYNLLPGNNKVLSFINNTAYVEDGTEESRKKIHGYPKNEMTNKEDMLTPVGAMLAYVFENGGQAAKSVALYDRYNEIIAPNNTNHDAINYSWTCIQNINLNFNYCDVNNPAP